MKKLSVEVLREHPELGIAVRALFKTPRGLDEGNRRKNNARQIHLRLALITSFSFVNDSCAHQPATNQAAATQACSQNPTEQAKLLKTVLLNCAIDELSVYPTYRKPFDLIFERAKTKEWSGREDLNLRPPGPEPGALPG